MVIQIFDIMIIYKINDIKLFIKYTQKKFLLFINKIKANL